MAFVSIFHASVVAAPVAPQPVMAPLEVLQAMTVMVTSEEEARMALQVNYVLAID